MAGTRPSSPSDTGANFLLTRFLDNINIPSTMEEGSRSKKSPLRLAKNTTTQDPNAPFTVPSTPERGSVSFARLSQAAHLKLPRYLHLQRPQLHSLPLSLPPSLPLYINLTLIHYPQNGNKAYVSVRRPCLGLGVNGERYCPQFC
jgi:hypothetical protein